MRITDKEYIGEASFEKYDEACFALLMEAYASRLGEKYLAESEQLKLESPDFPAFTDEKCLSGIRRAFSEKKRRAFKSKAVKSLHRLTVAAASVLLALALSSALLFNTVEAFRTGLVNAALNILDTGKGSIITVVPEFEDGGELLPAFLPEGYEMVEEIDSGKMRVVKYSNGSGIIRFSKVPAGSTVIDTEGAEVTKTTIGGYDAIIYSREGHAVCCWFDYDAGCVYILLADELDVSTITRIAQSCFE